MKFKYIVYFILFASLNFSCTEVIDMKFSTDYERLVVDGHISDQDTLHYILLSKINIDNEEEIVSPVSNALVVLNNGNDIVFEESINQKGLYVAPNGFIGEPGQVYNLSISNTGVYGEDESDSYFASAKMGNFITIDSVTAAYVNIPQFGLKGTTINCWANEPQGENYYLFKAIKNGVLVTDTLYEYAQAQDYFFPFMGRFSQYFADFKEDEFVESGDTLTLELSNIDEAFFNYLNTAQAEYAPSIPLFSGPSANVTTNVSNGAVGIFRVYSVSKGSVIMGEINRDKFDF